MLPTHRTQAIPVGDHPVCVLDWKLSLVRRLSRVSRVRYDTIFPEIPSLLDMRDDLLYCL